MSRVTSVSYRLVLFLVLRRQSVMGFLNRFTETVFMCGESTFFQPPVYSIVVAPSAKKSNFSLLERTLTGFLSRARFSHSFVHHPVLLASRGGGSDCLERVACAPDHFARGSCAPDRLERVGCAPDHLARVDCVAACLVSRVQLSLRPRKKHYTFS